MIKVENKILDKLNRKKVRRDFYLKNQDKLKARSLAYYHSQHYPDKKLRKGIEAYQTVMEAFYTKSHRLLCYKQLLEDMKEIKKVPKPSYRSKVMMEIGALHPKFEIPDNLKMIA